MNQIEFKEIIFERISDLLKIRTIITLSSIYVFLYLIVLNKINPDTLINFVGTLLGYWFGEKVGKLKVTQQIKGGNNANI